MRTEKDIGLRMCAYEAWRTTTGKKMPLESKEWDNMPQLASVSLPPKNPATSPFAGDAKPNATPTPSLLRPVVNQPAMTVPSNIQPASIQPATTPAPAGLPPTPVIIPSSMSSKP